MKTFLARLRGLTQALSNTTRYILTAPPGFVFMAYLRSRIDEWTHINAGSYLQEMKEFRDFAKKKLEITEDWFSTNIPTWAWALDRHLSSATPLSILEVGSFEGLSTTYILKKLPNSSITCVDTWLGSPENESMYGKSALDFTEVKRRFSANTDEFKGRVSEHVGTSLEFFSKLPKDKKFDLIYVDGSHEADDVLKDAIMSFGHLGVGGVMIFDDYLWSFFPRASDNPRAAINAFLSFRKFDLEIIHVGYQVIVRRTAP